MAKIILKDKSNSCHARAPKACSYCGREITYRKKWEKNWEEVKFCSDRCRSDSRKYKKESLELETKILGLLEHRGKGKTICPSEVLGNLEKQDTEKMEQVRRAARRLVHADKIEILQKGQIINPSDFRGPIRLRMKAHSAS